ncbi:MAG: hypothetical protein ABUS51_01735 [Acidobacteriota bacterium]
MTDAQIIAVSITVLAVLAGTLFNNSRIGDLNNRFSDINNRFADVNRHVDDVKDVLRAEMNQRFSSIDHKLDEILRIVGDHESRITAIEHRPR